MPKPLFRVKRYPHPKYKFLVRGKVLGKWRRRYFATEREAIAFADQQNASARKRKGAESSPENAAMPHSAEPIRATRAISTTDFTKLVTPTYLGPRIQRYLGDSWSMHLPFAYDLMRELAPRVFVELGVKQGESYFSFCQSAAENKINVRCYGVDSWRGDIQTGSLDPEIQREVAEYNWQYSSFSELKTMFFAEAVGDFPDATIDLLHIDGTHIYSDLQAGFELGVPKLSPQLVILYHHVMLRDRGFGVWKLWEEIAREGDSFFFEFGYGLGVWKNLSVATGDPPFIRRLLSADRTEIRQINEYYANAAAALALWHSLQRQSGEESEVARFKGEAEEKSQRLADLQRENEERQQQLSQVKHDAEERAKHIAILQRENEEKTKQVLLFKGDAEERAKHSAILQRENEEKTKQVLHFKGDAEERAKHIAGLQRENEEKTKQITHFRSEAESKAQRLGQLERESGEMQQHLAQLQADSGAKSRRLAVLQRRSELKSQRVAQLKERIHHQLRQIDEFEREDEAKALELQQLQQWIALKSDQILKLQRENERALQENERLGIQSQQLDEQLKQRSAELDEMRSELRTAQGDKERVSTEIERLRARMEQVNENLENKSNELVEARWEMLTLRADALRRMEVAEASAAPLLELQDRLEAATSDRDQLRGMIMALQSDVEQERLNVLALLAELRLTDHRASDSEERAGSAQRDCQDARIRLDAVEAQMNAARDRVKALQVQLYASEDRLSAAQERDSDTERRFEATLDQLNDTRAQLKATQEHLIATAKERIISRKQMTLLRDRVSHR